MTTEIDILKRVYARIKNPEHWCQGAEARDASGRECDPECPCAQQWCLWGALRIEKHVSDLDLALQHHIDMLLIGAAHSLYSMSVIEVNDELGHKAALKVLRQAIKSGKTKVSARGSDDADHR